MTQFVGTEEECNDIDGICGRQRQSKESAAAEFVGAEHVMQAWMTPLLVNDRTDRIFGLKASVCIPHVMDRMQP